ncbi:MAG TPA: class I SAM-dependent methyltransferase [Methanocella sp.]|jgi:SAM-dependent methyltransferase
MATVQEEQQKPLRETIDVKARSGEHVYQPNKSVHSGAVIDVKDGYEVIDCKSCGFRHVIPIPTPEQLSKLYAEDFYATEKPDYFKHVEEDKEWWDLNYASYYRLFTEHVKGKRLLEIGSGPGYFLKFGKEAGWDVAGFEPSRLAAEYSRKFGLNVINGPFDLPTARKLGDFDIVFMNLVIEHLADPVSLLKDVKEVLSKDGALCVISPNDYNPLQKILQEKMGFQPYWVAPPQHINYFDFRSITTLLERLDYEIMDKSSTFPMEFFLLSGDNYVGNDTLGRACHGKRKMLEKNMYTHGNAYLDNFYRSLARDSIGREFIVLAKPRR